MELRSAVVGEAPEVVELRNRLAEWMDRTLAWAERHIRRKGKERARLDVTAANGTLQQWYTDRGYRIVGMREFDHPGWNEVVLLEKSLSGRTARS